MSILIGAADSLGAVTYLFSLIHLQPENSLIFAFLGDGCSLKAVSYNRSLFFYYFLKMFAAAMNAG